MASPFASLSACPFVIDHMDEDLRQRIAYVSKKIKTPLGLISVCSEEPQYMKQRRKKGNFFSKNAGVLMVEKKKPFTVRFNLATNELLQ